MSSSIKQPFADISDTTICIMGPTASGKTDLACKLFDKNPTQFDIISVDSALVYRDMNIGTAKPSETELLNYPHELINIIDPTETYSAAQFATDAKTLIKSSHQKGKTPILVGGTMLYYKALFGGFDDIPASIPHIREKLSHAMQEEGLNTLYEKLNTVDPITATKLNSTDTQRILRALEVYEISGRPISSFQTGGQPELPDQWQLYALMPERSWLHSRIATRLEIMWQMGFLDEVIALFDKYQLTTETPSLRAVGYRQAVEYLKCTKQTNNDRQTMQDKALFATRQLAKRQFTWLRKFQKNYPLKTFQSHEEAVKFLI